MLVLASFDETAKTDTLPVPGPMIELGPADVDENIEVPDEADKAVEEAVVAVLVAREVVMGPLIIDDAAEVMLAVVPLPIPTHS